MSGRAVIYARQSLDRSGEGAAVERQTADCRALAQRRGWDVTEVITDNDMSASSGRVRPGYRRLLELMSAGSTDVVIVWHVDRLTRRLVDLEEVISLCEGAGVRLATVTGDLDLSTDTGRMLARILASVARGEVERKGVRQRRANEQRAAAGHMGWTRRPFGYAQGDGGRVVVVEDEAEALRDAATAVLAGRTLAAAIRDHLDRRPARAELGERCMLTTAHKRWNVTSLRRALLSPRYTGRVTYRGTDVGQGQWPVILTGEVQDRLAERLRDVRRRVQQGTEARYLLSGLVRCGRCDGGMFASPMGSSGHRWMVYKCSACYLARRLDLVDEVVEAVTLARLTQPDAAALLAPSVDVDGLRAEVVDLRRRRDDLAGLLADGLMSAVAVRDRSVGLTARVRELEDRIVAALGDSPAAALVESEDVAATWTALSVRERKAVVELLMTVTILPAGKGQRFRPDQVRIEWKGGR